jgi:thymidylate synthase (FAD)
MNVTLLHNTPLEILVKAIRTCWDSADKSDSFYPDVSPYPYFQLGAKDKALILAVIKKNHTSTLEHVTYNFKI